MLASEAELHAAFEHCEAFFLTRMDVTCGNICARGKVEIEFELDTSPLAATGELMVTPSYAEQLRRGCAGRTGEQRKAGRRVDERCLDHS